MSAAVSAARPLITLFIALCLLARGAASLSPGAPGGARPTAVLVQWHAGTDAACLLPGQSGTGLQKPAARKDPAGLVLPAASLRALLPAVLLSPPEPPARAVIRSLPASARPPPP